MFYDPTGRRKRLVSWIASAAAAIILVAGTAFAICLGIVHPPTTGPVAALFQVDSPHMAAPAVLSDAKRLAAELRDRERSLNRTPVSGRPGIAANRGTPAPMPSPSGRPLSIGFYVNWDDNSYPALQRTLPRLDWVVPAWLSLQGPGMGLKIDVDDRALNLINATRPGMPVLPLIQNAVDHGLEHRSEGHVVVRLLQTDDSMSIEIEDDGEGLPTDFDPARGGLGLQIIRTLVRDDLKGQFLLEDDGGVRAVVSFPRWRPPRNQVPEA